MRIHNQASGWSTLYRLHQNFILLLLLFATFRLLTVIAYRPGGLILDFSDFYNYRDFFRLERQGYITYQTMWTPYPPLFTLVVGSLWWVSTLIPPWEFDAFWMNFLLGSLFLFFEVGNFILLYLLALKISVPADALKSLWIYAGLFVPVYTITGWFESWPLFFFLLSLYLLLRGKPYWSAFFTGIGFMIKLIPLIILPLGLRHTVRSGRWGTWRIVRLNLTLDWQGVITYLAIFGITVLVIGLPYYLQNPRLILSPLQLSAARLPWETVWALLEGRYNYGFLPLDLRNLAWSPTDEPPSPLPWGWITLGFGLVYAYLYTRPIDWPNPQSTVAFGGLTVIFFLLYSKGYSPQWLGWLLVFSVLLLPNLRGTLYAIVLSVTNILEANIFFIVFPEETWLLQATVLIRTGLFLLLALEFCLILWPELETQGVIRLRGGLVGVGLLVLLIGLVPASRRLGTVYFSQRLAQSPYRATITWLQEQPVKEAILLNDHRPYDWFHPYLRRSHTFYMLDDYAHPGTTVEARMTGLMQTITAQHGAIWIFDADPALTTPAETVIAPHLAAAQLAHQADIDGGRLYLYIFP